MNAALMRFFEPVMAVFQAVMLGIVYIVGIGFAAVGFRLTRHTPKGWLRDEAADHLENAY